MCHRLVGGIARSVQGYFVGFQLFVLNLGGETCSAGVGDASIFKMRGFREEKCGLLPASGVCCFGEIFDFQFSCKDIDCVQRG